MADSILRLRVEDKDYDSRLRNATQGLNRYIDGCRKAGGTLAYVEQETLNFVKELDKMPTVAEGGYMAIKELRRSIVDLTIQYRGLTDEEKQSPFGQAMAQSIDSLTERAARVKDAWRDVDHAIRNSASDTKIFDQLAGSVSLATASFQTFQGAAKLLGVDMGDNVEVIAKLQAAMSVTIGLTQVQTALQKQSAVMQGVAAVQTSAHAAAQALLAKNTKMATAAGEALNAVSRSNPYVLLASAIAAVIPALVVYSKHQKQAAADAKLNEEAIQRAKKATEDYRSTLSSEYAQMMVKFDELKRAWMSISGEAEKVKWIQDNKKAFDALGISVNDLKSAEDVFEQNTANVIDGFRRRAEAAAIAANMVELYRQKMDLQQQAVDVYNQKRVQVYGMVPKEYLDQVRKTEGLRRDDTPNQWGETTYNNGRFIRGKNDTGPFTFSKSEADAYNNSLKTTDEQLTKIIAEGKQINKTIEQRNQRLMELERTTKTTTTVEPVVEDVEPVYPMGSLPQLTQQLKELQAAQSLALNPREWVDYQQQIEQTQYQIEAFKGQWRDGLQATITINDSEIMDQFREVEGMIVDEKTMTVTVNTADAYNQVRSLTSDIEGTTVEFKVQPELARGLSITTTAGLNSYISQLKQEIDQADLGSDLYNGLTSKLADATMLQNLVKESLSAGLGTALFDIANESGQDFWDRVLSPEGVENADWQAIADVINQKRKELGLDAITLDFNTGKVSTTASKSNDTWEQTQKLVSGMSQVNSGLQQMGVKLPEGVQKLVSTTQGVIAVINGIQTIIHTFSTTTAAAETAALTTNTSTMWALIAALNANTAAQSSDTIINGVKSVFSLFTLGAAGKHNGGIIHAATGTVVPGNHYSGDNIPALLDAGELVLNRAQQGNLASQLQENGSPSGSPVLPYVTGQTVFLGINNHLKAAGYGELVTTKMLRQMGIR